MLFKTKSTTINPNFHEFIRLFPARMDSAEWCDTLEKIDSETAHVPIINYNPNDLFFRWLRLSNAGLDSFGGRDFAGKLSNVSCRSWFFTGSNLSILCTCWFCFRCPSNGQTWKAHPKQTDWIVWNWKNIAWNWPSPTFTQIHNAGFLEVTTQSTLLGLHFL